VLLRRAYFDLVGLPPVPDEVRAFLAEDDDLAYERLIDRLLASPHYGERWGRHWLDVAGYADSAGILAEDRPLPLAFRYLHVTSDRLVRIPRGGPRTRRSSDATVPGQGCARSR